MSENLRDAALVAPLAHATLAAGALAAARRGDTAAAAGLADVLVGAGLSLLDGAPAALDAAVADATGRGVDRPPPSDAALPFTTAMLRRSMFPPDADNDWMEPQKASTAGHCL